MRRIVVLFISSMALIGPPFSLAESVHALFGPSAPQDGPFPSDRFTVPDSTQNTGLRVELPKPDCSARPSDCADLDVINDLDGFNLLPRLSIPFDGSIDVETVTSQSVFLVSLGNTMSDGDSGGRAVGINQVVWDTSTNTLHVESDELLDQHTRYVLVATKSVLDRRGKEVKAAKEFVDFVDEFNSGSTGDPALDVYRALLRNALTQIEATGVIPRGRVIAASVFTTGSVTAVLEKIRDQIKAATPAPADFLLGPGGIRTVFSRSAIQTIDFNRQMSADPAAPLSPPVSLGLSVLDAVPGAVGTIAFGAYNSADFRVHPGEFIPSVGTLSGTPLVQETKRITFVLFLPSAQKPTGGYPVAIYGHGTGLNKASTALVAAKLAQQGIATIGIDGPGNGFGPVSTYTVTLTDSSSVTLLSGGRGIDQNGNGQISEGEGFDAVPPRTILGGRDGRRQFVADNMQLVREIEVGTDVDGDAVPDLNPSRIYWLGPSSGGAQGAILLALEPRVRTGVLSSPGGFAEPGRLSALRGSLGALLQSRVPPLINSPGITSVDGISVGAPYFNENKPLRDGVSFRILLQDGTTQIVRSPLINAVAGAVEIQQVTENIEWASQSGSSVTFAPYIRRTPLDGVPAKLVIVQFANGDRVNLNPGVTAILRAGDLADRATFVRTDLIFPVNPTPFPGNPNLYPHEFMANAIVAANANVRAIALKAQHQIASFFASDGAQIMDPDDAPPALTVPIFEVPIAPPLPEALNYFP